MSFIIAVGIVHLFAWSLFGWFLAPNASELILGRFPLVLIRADLRQRLVSTSSRLILSVALTYYIIYPALDAYDPFHRHYDSAIIPQLLDALALTSTPVDSGVEDTSERPAAGDAHGLAARIPPRADAFALGLKASAEGRLDEARALLLTAKDRHAHEQARICLALGQVAFRSGDYGEAQRELEEAFAIDSSDPAIVAQLALVYRTRRNYVRAEALYAKVVDLINERPSSIQKHTALVDHGEVLEMLSRDSAALLRYKEALRSAIALDGPRGRAAFRPAFLLARLSRETGHYDDALRATRRLIVIAKRHDRVKKNRMMGDILLQLVDNYISLTDIDRAATWLGHAYLFWWRVIPVTNDIMAPFWRDMGIVSEAQGRYADAEIFMERTKLIVERHADEGGLLSINSDLAQLHAAEGMFTRAIQEVTAVRKRACEVYGSDSWEAGVYFSDEAALYLRANELDKAALACGRAMTIQRDAATPNRVVVTRTLRRCSDIFKRQGRYAEAGQLDAILTMRSHEGE